MPSSSDSNTPNPEFNPRSIDAMFATVLAEVKANHRELNLRMEQRDKVLDEKLNGIQSRVDLTNGKVIKHDKWISSMETKVATIAFCVSLAWLVGWKVFDTYLTVKEPPQKTYSSEIQR